MSIINYKKELNSEQYTVVTKGDGACLILAGAGSGKTRTLVYRIAYLLEQGISPENILVLTFTNKASREMLNRIDELLKSSSRGVWGGTFHSTANRILRKYSTFLGYENNYGILDMDDSKALIKICIDECGIDTKDKAFPKSDVILKIVSFSTNSQKDVNQVIEEKFSHLMPHVVESVQKVAEHYYNKKRAANVMDFDDLLLNWDILLRDFPEVREKLSKQFRYVLVDEYQDTNKIQSSIIKRISEEHKNILVVGDDAQSIYSFRAATISNILDFENQYKDAKVYKLVTNYRSTPEILDLANAIIAKNEKQFSKDLKSVKSSGGKPMLVPVRDCYHQANFINSVLEEYEKSSNDFSRIAILFRSSFQIIELELELNKRGVNYVVRGGMRFFDQAHIKDVMAYLRIILNPQDEVSWRRILLMYEGIGARTAAKIWDYIKDSGDIKKAIRLFDQIQVSRKGRKSLHQIFLILSGLVKIEDKIVPSSIKYVLDEFYENYMQVRFENYRERFVDLEQLMNFAVQYKNLSEFLADISLSDEYQKDQNGQEHIEKNKLILSTIHQAKGLEWDTVFVIGLAEGMFPHYKVFGTPKELPEERRLFYVACTRAEKNLYCMYPMSSLSAGTGYKNHRPSPFLTEIQNELFEMKRLPGVYCSHFFGEDDSFNQEIKSSEFEEDISGMGILERFAKVNKNKYQSLGNNWKEDGFYEDETIEYK